MLEDLLQAIETLKTRVEKHRAYLSEGKAEARTRTALIDPMLCALGWDVSDPSAVEIEPRTDEGWADYALLGSNGKPVIFVEAKKLSENVKSHAKQFVNYAVGENLNRSPKIQYCALTNGDVWQVFDVLSQDLILETSVSSPDPAKSALKFLGLWRRSLQDGGFDSAVEPLVAVSDGEGSPLAGQVQSPVLQPTSELPTPPSTAVEETWTPLTGNFATIGNPPPKAMKVPDGTEIPTKYWFEVLKQTAMFLVDANLLTPKNCQIKSSAVTGSTRYLFSLDGKHSNGKPFAFPSQLGDTGIILETNVSALDSVRQTRRLLEYFSQDPSQVYLKLS